MTAAEEFGQRLVHAMRSARMKNPTVATALGVHVITVSKWRSGTQPIEDHRIAPLARMLGVDEEWLRSGNTRPASDRERARGDAGQGQIRERPSGYSITAASPISRPLEIMIASFELEAMKSDADEEDMRYIRTALRSPEAVQLYQGGYTEPLTDDEQRVEMESLIEMLRLWLKERIKRRKDSQRRS